MVGIISVLIFSEVTAHTGVGRVRIIAVMTGCTIISYGGMRAV